MAAKINLRTGKIIGAEEGTFAFYHEKGHLAYDNSDLGITNGVYQNGALYCSLMFLALGQWLLLFKILAVFSVVGLMGLAVYEELWCNMYARDKLKELSLNNLKSQLDTKNNLKSQLDTKNNLKGGNK